MDNQIKIYIHSTEDVNLCFEKQYSIRSPELSVPLYKLDENIKSLKNIQDYLKPNELELLKVSSDGIIIPGNNVIVSYDSATEYIKEDLNIKNLNELGYVLKAGSFNGFFTLTDLMKVGYSIKVTNDCFYHLISNNKTLYIKPLPVYMTDGVFINKLLELNIKNEDKKDIIININGFLTSYRKLIKSKLDYQYAIDLKLLDHDIMTWNKWQILQHHMESNDIIFIKPRRYCYQVLNMTNINIVFFISNFKLLYSDVKLTISDFIMKYYIVSLYFFAFSSIFLSVAQVIMTLLISDESRSIWSNIFYVISIIILVFMFLVILAVLIAFIIVLIFKILKHLRNIEWK